MYKYLYKVWRTHSSDSTFYTVLETPKLGDDRENFQGQTFKKRRKRGKFNLFHLLSRVVAEFCLKDILKSGIIHVAN